MAKPSRFVSSHPFQTYFVTSSTWEKRSLFQSAALAKLFMETLFEYRKQRKYLVHAFVLMPDHFHIILTPMTGSTLERALQLIKGGFSYRVKKEIGKNLEIWQRGFTDRRIRNSEELLAFTQYIHQNPVAAHLAATASEYPYSSAYSEFVADPLPNYLSG